MSSLSEEPGVAAPSSHPANVSKADTTRPNASRTTGNPKRKKRFVNQRNLRTIVKAGTMGPLITLITLILEARNLRTARTHTKVRRMNKLGRT
ncbi:MAG: hypothetical protein LBK61_05390 [Spirochaetaceae bacterium]|jgi:hypothetical protein|nr:hypothetical protein [Spirochaetaceae bacterium]